MPKKIRAWYASYKAQCEENGTLPHRVKVWAGLELDKTEPFTPRAKELARFLGPAVDNSDPSR